MMPQMSGLELVREVRQANKRVPVVFISGYPGSEELEQEMRLLGGLFLKKPFNPWSLQRALRQALDEDVDDPDTV